MGRLGGSEVMMYVRSVMLERLRGRNEGGQRGGVTRMRVYRDNRVVRVLVMGERMGGGVMMRLSCGLDVVMVMFLSMRDSRDGGGGLVDNRRWRLISRLQCFISWFWRMISWFWRMISWLWSFISWFWGMISWFRR